MSELRKQTRWTGEYRGVSFEIHHYPERDEGRGGWTFYLYLGLDRIPDTELAASAWLKPIKDKKDRVFYDYSDSWLASLDWHYGITFYEKVGGFDGAMKRIKVGCDYMHYWDEGSRDSYNQNWLQSDAEKAIDSFLAMVPDYKLHCPYIGGYWLPTEGKVISKGFFVSNKGLEWDKATYPEEPELRD